LRLPGLAMKSADSPHDPPAANLREESNPPRGDALRRTSETPFTGERPGWGEGFEYDYARHIAAYRVAEPLVVGRRALDAGCGEGFGTQSLAAVAREVVGVDYSADAIAECRRLWTAGRTNLRFEQVDLSTPSSSSGSSSSASVSSVFAERFDVVLSFQVLEHMREPQTFLRRLAEFLEPGGTLMLTTPNRLRSASENPYHVREYTAAELRRELEPIFANVSIRGMHGNAKIEEFEEGRARAVHRILRLDPLGIRNLLPKSIVEFAFARLARVARRRARPADAPAIVPEDFSLRDEDVDRALDLVAFCSGTATR
jgi:2-polyprenyl-3-methyl-5-hydroxy-6-metoxy-1,4-benzoquinol methylase